ncbi:MAG: GspE/PulE family protein [Opitutales bacterium]
MTQPDTQAEPVERFLAGLPEADRETVLALPREDRLAELARLTDRRIGELAGDLATACGLPFLDRFQMAEDATSRLPLRVMHAYHCLPLAGEPDAATGAALPLVTVWPPDAAMDRWIRAVTGRPAAWHLGLPDQIGNTLTQQFGVGSGSLEDSDIADDLGEAEEEDTEDQNAAVIRFVNEVVQKAVVDRATDIHFEPHRDSLQIRYRIDGQLVPVRVPDNLRQFQGAITSRLKIMARLNISEKRRPQDGRITFQSGQGELDIRISTFPTLYGESVSLRLLNTRSQPLTVRELGLLPEDEEKVNHAVARPYGIILVTGPTGSGKSTSLTAFIRKINTPERRIITVEDPVEYEVPGVNQTQIRTEIGLNFASALRHVLRQDPDVIMVGEIRDRDTADIAIRASLTGHLVLSTLHTNDAPGALTRLIDMDIEPFLIASSVEMIIAQRLVRRLCPACARPATFPPGHLAGCLTALGLDPAGAAKADGILEAVGCEQCRSLGYRGRVGIFEILGISDAIHELIVQKASARMIRQQAIREGMKTLQTCGWQQVRAGLTTLEEVMRFAETTEEETEAAAGSPLSPPEG